MNGLIDLKFWLDEMREIHRDTFQSVKKYDIRGKISDRENSSPGDLEGSPSIL